MKLLNEKFKVGFLPGMVDLYNRFLPKESVDRLKRKIKEVVLEFEDERWDIYLNELVSSSEEINRACKNMESQEVDLLVIPLMPYCTSGMFKPALLKTNLPIVLLPLQPMSELKPEKYNDDTLLLNQGVPGIQSLANTLRRSGKPFGVMHKHWHQNGFSTEISNWIRAGRAIHALQCANPVQLGGHFEDMVDLQVDQEAFIKEIGLKPKIVSLKEFAERREEISKEQENRCIELYRSVFTISTDVDEALLSKTARGEAALRRVMSDSQSFACGANFVTLCNDETIGDTLHAAVSVLMSEGYGYGAEGDWMTASLVYAMNQATGGAASLSEMISAGYRDNRMTLIHFGEGNITMAREKPKLMRRDFIDRRRADFACVDFEFDPGAATLVNLTTTPDSSGQLISITGTITEDHLPEYTFPRAVFKPDTRNIGEILSKYAYAGGSHHLALIKGDGGDLLTKVARLTGWDHLQF